MSSFANQLRKQVIFSFGKTDLLIAKYTNNAFAFLLSANILGATEEIIDLILELRQTAKMWYEGYHKLVVVFISVAIAFEIVTAIYLATFYPIVLQVSTIIIQCIFALIACYFCAEAGLFAFRGKDMFCETWRRI